MKKQCSKFNVSLMIVRELHADDPGNRSPKAYNNRVQAIEFIKSHRPGGQLNVNEWLSCRKLPI